MTNQQALYIIWSSILNQSQKAEKTLNSTFMIMERLGLIEDFDTSLKNLTYDAVYNIMNEKPMPHRFYNKMTNNLFLSVKHIMQMFEGIAKNVFVLDDKDRTIQNLVRFRGIGMHKAELAYIIASQYEMLCNPDQGQFDKLMCCSACPSLERTILSEFRILDSFTYMEL